MPLVVVLSLHLGRMSSSGTAHILLLFKEFNPKDFEHQRRYRNTKTDHCHIHLLLNHKFLDHGENIWIVNKVINRGSWFVYLRSAQGSIRNGQKFILAGCFSDEQQDFTWEITGNTSYAVPTPMEVLKSNAQEADMCLWKHA